MEASNESVVFFKRNIVQIATGGGGTSVDEGHFHPPVRTLVVGFERLLGPLESLSRLKFDEESISDRFRGAGNLLPIKHDIG